MILYDYVLSASCYKVRLMAALLNISLKPHAVNFHPERAHKSDEMLALNPAGTLPILVDGPIILSDTADILKHLTAENEDWRHAEDDTWLMFAGRLNDSLGMARLHDVIGYDADIDAVRALGILAIRELEAHLTQQRFEGHIFLTGSSPTIADIACFPNIALAPDGGVSIDFYPSIRLWLRAIRSLPGFIEMPGIHRMHELVEVTA